uniref:RRM domain-containing protein n=1 Tax=Aegilops tauschii subsp. strangulata TaxID=200361 RepID=A0A453DHL8_AEGTS
PRRRQRKKVAGARMGCKSDLADQLQEDGSDGMNAVAAEYEEGSEEEEPFEREFYDDDDDEDNVSEPETQAVDPCEDHLAEEEEANGDEPCDGATPLEDEDSSYDEPFVDELCYEEEDSGEQDSYYAEPFTDQLCEVEPCDVKVAHAENFVKKKSSPVEAIKKEQNEEEVLKQALGKGSSHEHKAVPVTDEIELKPFKKRLSVRFATDVSCYTYSTESFGAAKLEKRKAQFDDQDSRLCKRQEHTVSLPQEGVKLKEVDDTNLYVGNLPASVTSNKLKELFLPFGRIVQSRVADDRFTGVSRGYGFVKYAEPRSATAAIGRMNGRLVDGKTLEVRVAEVSVPPSVSNPSMQSVSETYGLPSKEIDPSHLYVCNLPLAMDTLKLLEYFLPFGKVTDIRMPRDHTTGLSKGYGFVKYSDSHHAAQAIIHLNGFLVEGKKIEVRLYDSSPPRPTKEIDMANLYVCNIPVSIDTNKLVELFSPFGKITQARVAADQGYGFVKFADSQCAAEAIALMNGSLVEGETLIVRVAGLSSSASSSAVQVSPIASPEINKSRLYVTNLPRTVNADKLVELFVPFGQISKVMINLEYSLVFYADVASAIKAVERMDGYLIGGKRLVVRRSDSSCPTDGAEHASSQSAAKPTREIDMANLCVAGIPPTMTGDQLVELFRPYGQIVQSRMFRGYGMVRYENPSSAAAAIDHMDGYLIGGSTLAVRISGLPNPVDFNAAANAPLTLQQRPANANAAATNPMDPYAATNAPPTPQLQQPWPANGPQKHIDMTNLYVCHLPPYITTQKLTELFLPCGQITQAKAVVDLCTGVCKGYGFVKFADTYASAVALTYMNGYPLEGHILEVRIAGVHQSAMGGYMAHLYSQFTVPDPSKTAIGVPTSHWPYHCAAESAYTENQGQGTDAASQTSQPPESLSASSSFAPDMEWSPVSSTHLADTSSQQQQLSSHATDTSSQQQQQPSAGWAGPPGFEPHHVHAAVSPPQPPSSAVPWAGPPGFEPHSIPKKDAAAATKPSQRCSKVHLAQSGGSQKRRSIV